MTSKKWCIMFFLSVVLIFGSVAVTNILVDPFGVFGDKIFNWFSFDFTNNPRVAKITYLDKHYKEYDSYLIGCSSTSSFPTEDLNKYFDAKFYNMIMYGADMLDVEKTCRYILDNYDAKNIVINTYLLNGAIYDEENDKITRNLHTKVEGDSSFLFYFRYLFLNPEYAVNKVKDYKKDTYLTQPFDVFNIKTGAYDKKVRDAEAFGDLNEYLEKYPVFKNYPSAWYELTKISDTVGSLQRIKDMCDEKNVNLVFVTSPTYYENIKYFPQEDVAKFYKAIADVMPFWDFSSSSISMDPRYFYDETHFRNSVGRMALAKMFDDKSVYYPEDFGFLVTNENVDEYMEKYFNITNDVGSYTKNLPVLMYHNIAEETDSTMTITIEKFEEQMKFLKDNSYTPISLDELYGYIERGIELPEKCVMITFDDGYYSNYEYAFPILKDYGFKATIFVIGSSVGHKDFYKDTSFAITPHFSYEEAKEMEESGLISIQSHTYDMHQWAPFESGNMIREDMLTLSGESEADMIEALRYDFEQINKDFNENLGKNITAVAFPHGRYETLTHVILREEGVKATFATNEGINTIIKGIPQSILGLKRFNISDETDISEILN